MTKTKKNTLKLVYSAVCLALAFVLPIITGYIPQIGNMLCPMHIAILLCGFLCGWQYGLGLGIIAPILRSLIFGMPPMYPIAVAMAFELATYGLISGLLYKLFPKKAPYVYLSLVSAMIAGRCVWGFVRYIMAGISGTEFPFSAFISGAITTAWPGILIQIVLIPIIIIALKKAKLVPNR